MTELSIQLYSVRDNLGDATENTFEVLRELGYRNVEPFDILTDPIGLRRYLQMFGLRAPTAHASFLRFGLEPVLEAAKAVGVDTVILPSAPRDSFVTREGVLGLAATINRASTVARNRGITLGYHNHEYEFESTIDGVPAWEFLLHALDEEVVMELDLHWASVGGANVFDLTSRFAERIRFLHVNDEELGIEEGFAPNPHDGVPADVVRGRGPQVELAVVEVVEDGNVFPSLRRNSIQFWEALQ